MDDHYLTVGRLRQVIEGLPDDTPVLFERIEDVYFEKHGWTSKKIPDPLFQVAESEFIRAWDASQFEDEVLIHGHY